MKSGFSGFLNLCLLLILLNGGVVVSASETPPPVNDVRFNNNNWYTLPHPKVASFSIREDGSMLGFTENGITFVQYNVQNTYNIRVQRFEIQDHYHYIVNGEIADTVHELSALLALAYNESTRG